MPRDPHYPLIPLRLVGRDFLLLTLIWCLGICLVNPVADFPLIDDWSYGMAARHFAEHGDFHPGGWVAMPLLTNVLWGALFCLPAGFSFTALRLSTLVAAWLGIGGSYLLVREQGGGRRLAWLAALLLGFNPAFYELSYTFMTDVPFFALSTFTVLFLARHIRQGRDADLLLGALLAVASVLSRQLGLAAPLAFVPALLLARGVSRGTLLRALTPLALCLAASFSLHHWLAATGRIPALYDFNANNLRLMLAAPTLLVSNLLVNSALALHFLGWFLLPALLVLSVELWRAKRSALEHIGQRLAWRLTGGRFALPGLAGAVVLGCLLVVWQQPAYEAHAPDMLVKEGMGPLSLTETFPGQVHELPLLPAGFWWGLNTAAYMGGALLLVCLLLRALRSAPSQQRGAVSAGPFIFLIIGIYLVPILATGFYDRYLLPLLPLLVAGLTTPALPAEHGRGWRRYGLAALLVGFGVCFALAGTRDYLAWNRARWQALDDLVTVARVPVGQIDGGFEYDGLHFYDPRYRPPLGKGWWWIPADTYRIGFGPWAGYEVVRAYPFPHLLPAYTGRILVLKKLTRAQPVPPAQATAVSGQLPASAE